MSALRIIEHAQPYWKALRGLLYPVTCSSCLVSIREHPLPLCYSCLHKLDVPTSAEIGAQLETMPTQALAHASALWYFDKDGPIQQIQHALKYGNRPAYGRILGQWIVEGLKRDGAPLAYDLIVPIPLHRHRLLERGYNQSASLARGISETLDIPHAPHLLLRNRATRSQTSLSQQARWKNVAGAFSIQSPERIHDATVLLVDDVLTTGATATAAACVLREAGASNVGLATLAFART